MQRSNYLFVRFLCGNINQAMSGIVKTAGKDFPRFASRFVLFKDDKIKISKTCRYGLLQKTRSKFQLVNIESDRERD